MFIFNELTVIVLRETNAQWYRPTFKSPLYPWVQGFGIVSGIVLLAFLGIMPVVSVLGVVVLGFLIFLVYGSKSDRSGVATSYGIISSFFKGASKIREYSEVIDDSEEVITTDADVVVTHQGLAGVAKSAAPENSVLIQYVMFMNDPSLNKLIKDLSEGNTITSS